MKPRAQTRLGNHVTAQQRKKYHKFMIMYLQASQSSAGTKRQMFFIKRRKTHDKKVWSTKTKFLVENSGNTSEVFCPSIGHLKNIEGRMDTSNWIKSYTRYQSQTCSELRGLFERRNQILYKTKRRLNRSDREL